MEKHGSLDEERQRRTIRERWRWMQGAEKAAREKGKTIPVEGR